MPSPDLVHRPPAVVGDEEGSRAATPVVRLPDGRASAEHGLRRALDEALARGPRTLVVDMSGVDHVTSSTIGALLTVQERCAARGVQAVLRRPNRRNLEALRRIGLMSHVGVEGAGGSHRAERRSSTGATS